MRCPPKAPSAATPEEDEPLALRLSRNPLLDRTIRERAEAGNVQSALHLLHITKGLTVLYGSQLRAEIAQALFTQGRDAEAFQLAQDAFHQSSGRVGLAAYVAGLAAWRMRRPDIAQPLFEQASRAELNSTALSAGAAFWAARAHVSNHDPMGYEPWMRRAAQGQRTFYGLLARRMLGMGTGLSPLRDTLGACGHRHADGHAAGQARLRPAAGRPKPARGGGAAAACGPPCRPTRRWPAPSCAWRRRPA